MSRSRRLRNRTEKRTKKVCGERLKEVMDCFSSVCFSGRLIVPLGIGAVLFDKTVFKSSGNGNADSLDDLKIMRFKASRPCKVL